MLKRRQVLAGLGGGLIAGLGAQHTADAAVVRSVAERLAEAVLRCTPPRGVRVAFSARVQTSRASHWVAYDPRRPRAQRWRERRETGSDPELDQVVGPWGAMPAPDARLLPDILAARLAGGSVRVNSSGEVRLTFDAPTEQGEGLGAWLPSRLAGTALMPPGAAAFSAVNLRAHGPFDAGPAQVSVFDQTYGLEVDALFDISLIRRFDLRAMARLGLGSVERRLSVDVLEVEPFFATRGEVELADKPTPQAARTRMPR